VFAAGSIPDDITNLLVAFCVCNNHYFPPSLQVEIKNNARPHGLTEAIIFPALLTYQLNEHNNSIRA
jgi:hypothetical protein